MIFSNLNKMIHILITVRFMKSTQLKNQPQKVYIYIFLKPYFMDIEAKQISK